MAAKQEKARNARESNPLNSVVSCIHKQPDVPGSQSSHTLPVAISRLYHMKTGFMFNSGSYPPPEQRAGWEPQGLSGLHHRTPLGSPYPLSFPQDRWSFGRSKKPLRCRSVVREGLSTRQYAFSVDQRVLPVLGLAENDESEKQELSELMSHWNLSFANMICLWQIASYSNESTFAFLVDASRLSRGHVVPCQLEGTRQQQTKRLGA